MWIAVAMCVVAAKATGAAVDVVTVRSSSPVAAAAVVAATMVGATMVGAMVTQAMQMSGAMEAAARPVLANTLVC